MAGSFRSRHERRAGAQWDGYRWIYPDLEQIRDLSWGEIRLAAEAAIAELRGQLVPTWVHERAFDTLNRVAFA